MRPTKILVTGGAGYLGSVLVPRLLDNHDVTVLDSFRYGQNSLLDCCDCSRLTIVRGDVTDERLVRDLMKDADVIIPLACITGAPACDQHPIEARLVNLDAIATIMRYRSKEQHVIFPTTNSGYGIGEPGVLCTEETPLKPVSLYGRLKVAVEMLVLEQENTVSLRLATAFGVSPRMRLDLLVNDFVYRAVTDGFVVLYEPNFKRNFIHVRDIARAFTHVIWNFVTMRGNAYNVGLSDANLSKLELCHVIKELVPRFSIMTDDIGRDPDQRDYIVSNAKIEATGFKPAWSLHDGIRELLKGYQIIRRSGYGNV